MPMHRDIRRHVGQFLIPAEWLDPGYSHVYAHRIQHIMSYMVIIKCEHRYDLNSFEYTAFSWLFNEHPRGWIVPMYRFYFVNDGLKFEMEMG